MKPIVALFFLLCNVSANAQFGSKQYWITVPNIQPEASGLYLFRKVFELTEKPNAFKILVSADPRYKLYVNETLVSVGPALGDIFHWNYEKVDLAPYLNVGKNVVAVQVWNEGNLKASAQFSYRTAFIVDGTDKLTRILNTDNSWKCIKEGSYAPIQQKISGVYFACAGERIDMHNKPKGWEKRDFNDSNWQQAEPIVEKILSGFANIPQPEARNLTPSIIPAMELTKQTGLVTRKAEGVTVPSNFPSEKSKVKIPANTTAKILIDQTFLTNAYPTLEFSGGENSQITLTYAEGLYGEKMVKNNRNDIDGKTISGRNDIVISDGSIGQNFTTLNYRTYRYVEIKVETKNTPLVIDNFYGTFTGYPFKLKANIDSKNKDIQKIFEIGWRTARLCAVETYMDCPYYEQLQYIGDTRIQAMVSFYNSGDDRLVKNALNLMDYSRQKDGLTLSSYPNTNWQSIPLYSLWYISMLHDYMMYGSDVNFIKGKLIGARQIMSYFINYMDNEGSLKKLQGWKFTDWTTKWGQLGIAPSGSDGSSAVMDLQFLIALQAAEDMEQREGIPAFANLYHQLSQKLAETIQKKYWDTNRQLYGDTPEKNKFSQHANSMAILAGLVKTPDLKIVGKNMLADTSLAEASIYFKYYQHLALVKAGFGDAYLSWLDTWRKNIALGLTTWGENFDVESTRSDCHAWGASPNIEFFRTLLGIESDAPYFKKVRIEPHLGDIEEIGGEMPHPNGIISVHYKKIGTGLTAKIVLPKNISGVFIWNGKTHNLVEGINEIK